MIYFTGAHGWLRNLQRDINAGIWLIPKAPVSLSSGGVPCLNIEV